MPICLQQPHVMGILNVTPDSFSDGGRFVQLEAALQQARQMVEEGATILDIGGESTRPNSDGVSEQLELDRVMPVVERVRAELPVAISVDTMKPAVMRAAIASGVEMINDVLALQAEGAVEAVAASDSVQVCLMHMKGEPRTMQQQPEYALVVAEVKDFLLARAACCEAAGIGADRIVLDIGFGFGKTPAHNVQLVKALSEFTALPYPSLLGVSRKSTLGAITGKPVDGRLYAGLAMATLGFYQGVKIVRTHDVAATVDVLRTVRAVLGEVEI